jgi:hypothetical protein
MARMDNSARLAIIPLQKQCAAGRISMKIRLERAEPAEAGDYYQVLFEDLRDEVDAEKTYFLIQRQFEFPDGGVCYVESHDEDYIGHAKVKRATLGRNRLILELQRRRDAWIEVEFETSERNFREVVRIMRIMIPAIRLVEAEQSRRSR